MIATATSIGVACPNHNVSAQSAKNNEAPEALEGYWVRFGFRDRKNYLRFLKNGVAEKGTLIKKVGAIGVKTYDIQITKTHSGTWSINEDQLETQFPDETKQQKFKLKTNSLTLGKDLYLRLRVEEIRANNLREKKQYERAKNQTKPHPNASKIAGFWTRDMGTTAGTRVAAQYIFRADGRYIQTVSQTKFASTKYENLVEAKWLVDDTSVFIVFPEYVFVQPYQLKGNKLELGFKGMGKIEMETMDAGGRFELAEIESLIQSNKIKPFDSN